MIREECQQATFIVGGFDGRRPMEAGLAELVGHESPLRDVLSIQEFVTSGYEVAHGFLDFHRSSRTIEHP
ncbi:MAG: hypothetical protein R3200_12705 [Xanthomonadales bacterium]|nr:hypothetical protein [Xanthomonadales bacterium]